MSVAFAPPGRCGNCGARVGAPGYLVEVALLGGAVVLWVAHRPGWETAALGWWLVWAVGLAFVDVGVHRLPNRMTFPAALGTVALLGVAALVEHRPHAWVRAVLAAAGVAVFFAVLTLVFGRRGPGLGDAKLMLGLVAVLGWLGWPAVVDGLLLGLVAQAVVGVGTLLAGRRGTRLPMGPFMVAGAVAAVALLG
jgi:leader peptidase (prepilin peptidase) / N-methyltransferase